MNRDETVALFLQGREAWNDWGQQMLEERKALEEAGRWETRRASLQTVEEGNNPETQAWNLKAFADFSGCHFEIVAPKRAKRNDLEATFLTLDRHGTEAPRDDAADNDAERVKTIQLETEFIDFRGFIFPNIADFSGCNFIGSARFGSATFAGEALFKRTTFSGEARFRSADFFGDASFDQATFNGDALFASVNFTGSADFRKSTFARDASFRSAAFTGDSDFQSAAFSGEAEFVSATFSGIGRFVSVSFRGNASFTAATFHKSANYWKASFEKETSFMGVKVDRAFNMMGAAFSQMPAFNQADFKQPPDLDFVEFPLPPFWPKGNAGLIAKYRAIRRMAIQGADYEREQMAYKGELRSRRWFTDKWWHLGTWFGLLYDGLADCGRSMVRPLVLWVALLALFPGVYLLNAGVPAGVWMQPCPNAETRKLERAMSLSVNAGMPFIGGSRTEEAREFQGCVRPSAGVPLSLTMLQAVQTLSSAVVIFLLLLAVRNRFKIK